MAAKKTIITCPTLLEFLEEADDFVPTVTCPVCGKIEDEHGNLDCPHYIGNIEDLDCFYWIEGFEILTDIGKNLYFHSEDIAQIIDGDFDGIPYWDKIDFTDSDMSASSQ